MTSPLGKLVIYTLVLMGLSAAVLGVANAGELHFNMYNYAALWLDEEGLPNGLCLAHSTDPNLDGPDFPDPPGEEECVDWENEETQCVDGQAHSNPRDGWVPNEVHNPQSGCSGHS